MGSSAISPQVCVDDIFFTSMKGVNVYLICAYVGTEFDYEDLVMLKTKNAITLVAPRVAQSDTVSH